ncbi:MULTISPECIES: hypothetical protein [unclassified Bartonella]|uniref:hypothetical protein n=1 Tax=unclassified Bartonella TaxID=2645622 RepID=UPI0035CF7363
MSVRGWCMLESCFGGVGCLCGGVFCYQRVCFSLKVFEAALLMSACQEHGKWRLGKRRKVERRKGVKEGRGGYA